MSHPPTPFSLQERLPPAETQRSDLASPARLPTLKELQEVLLGAQRRYDRWLRAEWTAAKRKTVDRDGEIIREVLLASKEKAKNRTYRKGLKVTFIHTMIGTYYRVTGYVLRFSTRFGEPPETGTLLDDPPAKKVFSLNLVYGGSAPAKALVNYMGKATAEVLITSRNIYGGEIGLRRLVEDAYNASETLRKGVTQGFTEEAIAPNEMVPNPYGIAKLLQRDDTIQAVRAALNPAYYSLRVYISSSLNGWTLTGVLYSKEKGVKAAPVRKVFGYGDSLNDTPLDKLFTAEDYYGPPRVTHTSFGDIASFEDKDAVIRRVSQVARLILQQWVDILARRVEERQRAKLMENESYALLVNRQTNAGVFEALCAALREGQKRVGTKNYLKAFEVLPTGTKISRHRGAVLEAWRLEIGIWAYRVLSWNTNREQFQTHSEGLIHAAEGLTTNDLSEEMLVNALYGTAQAHALSDPVDSVKLMYKRMLDKFSEQQGLARDRQLKTAFASGTFEQAPAPIPNHKPVVGSGGEQVISLKEGTSYEDFIKMFE